MKLVTVGDFILKVIYIVGEIKAKLRAIVHRLHQIQVLYKWVDFKLGNKDVAPNLK